MYRHRVWPALVMITVVVLCWALAPATDPLHLLLLAVGGTTLALLAWFEDSLSVALRRIGLAVLTVIATGALGYAAFAFADPLTAVPFLALLGGIGSFSWSGRDDGAAAATTT